MSTAAYLRVSTDEQDHARQRRAVRECMKDNGLSAADDLWFSDKESRDLDYKRPDFQRMMRLVEKGSIRTIVVEKFDRFGVQDVDEWFAYRHKLRQHDCRLLSAIDGDLTGKDVSTMIRTFFHADQSEKEQMSKSQRVLSGKVQKAQDHAIWNGGVAPFGFDRACYDSQGRLLWMFHYLTRGSGIRVSPCKRCKTAERTADGNRPCVECERVECNGEKEMPRKQPKSSDVIKLVPSENQNRIDIIRAVFRWYIEQAVGTAAVAANCNDAGWKWYGREFTHEDVRRILTNPAYVGELAFNRHSVGRFHEFDGARVNELPLPKGGKRVAKYRKNPEARHVTRAGKWTALIDSKTWDAAQKKLKDREKGPRPPRNPDCWLKAILYCGNCRQPMIVRRIKKRVTYICKSYHNAKMYRLPCACGLNMVRHDVAEKVIMDYLARLKIDLASGSDREVLLKLYEVRGQKTDLLAQTIRKGIHFYAETIRETFRLERKKSRLAGMVDKLALAFDLLETLKRPDGAPLFGEQASSKRSTTRWRKRRHWHRPNASAHPSPVRLATPKSA